MDVSSLQLTAECERLIGAGLQKDRAIALEKKRVKVLREKYDRLGAMFTDVTNSEMENTKPPQRNKAKEPF